MVFDRPTTSTAIARTPLTKMPFILLMVCTYVFLAIERPWESISYLRGVQVERFFAVFMILVAFISKKLRIVRAPTNFWVFGLLLLHFILAPFAFNPIDAVEQGIEYCKLAILYVLMLSVSDDERSLKLLVKSFALSMIFYTIHSLWEYHNGRHDYKMGIVRMLGVDNTFNDPNAFGASVVLSLPFMYALLKSETNSIFRNLYYCYFPIAIFCVLLTGSRSAFVALIALLIVWTVRLRGPRRVFALLVFTISLCCVWLNLPQAKQDRIRTLWNEDVGPANAHESAQGRIDGLIASWRMFKQNSLTGVGAGGKNFIGYRMANNIDDEHHQAPLQAHILYGQVLAEFGIGGAILFIGLVVSTWRCGAKVRAMLRETARRNTFEAHLAPAILITLFLLLLLGLSGHNFYRPLWLWLAAWASSLLIISQRQVINDV